MASDCKASIIVLGESGVGKTSLLTRFTKGTFKELIAITTIDVLHAQLNVKNKKVRLELWDTGGQDRFRAIVRQYYRKADGVLLIYDVTNICTFHKLSSWLDELRCHNEKAVVIIVGNKTDHPDKKEVSLVTVRRFAENEGMDFFETSAKNGENVYQIFESLSLKILEAKGIVPSASSLSSEPIITEISTSNNLSNPLTNNETESTPESEGGTISLNLNQIKKEKKKKCC